MACFHSNKENGGKQTNKQTELNFLRRFSCAFPVWLPSFPALSRNVSRAGFRGRNVSRVHNTTRQLSIARTATTTTTITTPYVFFYLYRFELGPSVEVVKASCNLSGEGIPNTVIAPGLRNKEEAKRKV